MEYLLLDDAEAACKEAAMAADTLGGFETDCETCSFDVNLVSAAAEAAAAAEWYETGGNRCGGGWGRGGRCDGGGDVFREW